MLHLGKHLGLTAVTLAVLATRVEAQTLYWSVYTPPKIQRAQADGSDVIDLVSSFGGGNPAEMALDTQNGYLYWLNSPSPGTRIQRADLDGSNIVTVVPLPNGSAPRGIALNLAAGKMYWTLAGLDKIQVANLDGTGVADLITNVTDPYGIAIDLGAGKIYWSTSNFGGKIQRANLDGTGIEDIVIGQDYPPYTIRLDLGRGKLYWSNFNGDIYKANLDGTSVEFVLSGPATVFELARSTGHIYFAEQPSVGIRRADLDGSNAVTVVPDLTNVSGLAIDTRIPLDTSFTYQGRLTSAGVAAEGPADFEFQLWDAPEFGNTVGTVQSATLGLVDGIFSVPLDFGASAFDGAARWLEAAVRYPAGAGPFSTLEPRQPVTAAPYAQHCVTATSADVAQSVESVSWSDLSEIPAGFADGVDNGGDGHSLDALDGNPVDVVYVDGAGNVGIGTQGPVNKLTVLGNANITGNLGLGVFTPANRLSVTGNADVTGSVGIGTTTPSNPLTVVGNANVTGSLGIGVTPPLGVLHVNAAAGDTSVRLPDSSVASVECLDEPGVASATNSPSIGLDGTVQTILSRDITAPAAGYVLAIATGQATISHVNGTTSSVIFGVSDTAGAFPANQDVSLVIGSTVSSGLFYVPVTVHGLFSVAAGARTFRFLADENSGSWNVEDMQLTLVYFPTAYGAFSPPAGTADQDQD